MSFSRNPNRDRGLHGVGGEIRSRYNVFVSKLSIKDLDLKEKPFLYELISTFPLIWAPTKSPATRASGPRFLLFNTQLSIARASF